MYRNRVINRLLSPLLVAALAQTAFAQEENGEGFSAFEKTIEVKKKKRKKKTQKHELNGYAESGLGYDSNPYLTPSSAYLDYTVGVYRAFAGGSDRLDEDLQRRISARCYDRMFYPRGFPRQMAAILAAPGRRAALKTVRVPTLVMHGSRDALFPIEHGRDTAAAIPGAGLAIVEGLGHGMAYPALWEEIVNTIAEFTRRVE